MSVRLVDLSPAGQALRSAAGATCNELFDLSLQAGGLAGLLELIAGNGDGLTEQQCMAVGALADMAQRIENEITAIADRLGEAMEGNEAQAN